MSKPESFSKQMEKTLCLSQLEKREYLKSIKDVKTIT